MKGIGLKALSAVLICTLFPHAVYAEEKPAEPIIEVTEETEEQNEESVENKETESSEEETVDEVSKAEEEITPEETEEEETPVVEENRPEEGFEQESDSEEPVDEESLIMPIEESSMDETMIMPADYEFPQQSVFDPNNYEGVNVFRELYSFEDFKAGYHYVITSYNRHALTYSEDETSGYCTDLDDHYDGPRYSYDLPYNTSYTTSILKLSDEEVSNADYVFTCTKTGEANTWSFSYNGLKLRANSGKFLQLGYSSANTDTMFSDKGGELTCFMDTGTPGYNEFSINHSTYASLKFDYKTNSFSIGSGLGTIQYYRIMTDAPLEKTPVKTGLKNFRRVAGSNFLPIGTDFLMVYHDPDTDQRYALTADGVQTIAKDNITENPYGVSDIRADMSYSWRIGSRPSYTMVGYWSHDYGYTSISHDGKYFQIPSGYTGDVLIKEENPDTIIYFDSHSASGQNYLLKNAQGTGLAWDGNKFVIVEGNSDANLSEIEIYAQKESGNLLTKFYRLNALSEIQEEDHLLITLSEAGLEKVVVPTYHYNTETGDLTNLLVATEDEEPEISENMEKDPDAVYTTEQRKAVTVGPFKSTSNTKYKISGLTWETNKTSLYVDGLAKENPSAHDKNLKEVLIVPAGTDENGIALFKLRGAKKWLVYRDGAFTYSDTEEGGSVFRLWKGTMQKEVQKLSFHYPDGTIVNQPIIDKVSLPLLDDMTVEKEDYIFVGWSKARPKARTSGEVHLLSIEDSCDLYDYDDVTKTGSIKPEVKEKYQLVGNCNPENPEMIDPYELDIKNTDGDIEDTKDLYTVFARAGFESAISADEGDRKIVSISDWKDIQTGSVKEGQRWLGRIFVNVYRDGQLWVDSKEMYFSYHNDDAADINIKFVEDSILKDKFNNDLYEYNSGDDFPMYSQIGRYVIDAVYADQGGSEDGLKYKYNWMTFSGGQLDNVKGGSTINVYVTTLYQVKYYLDDQLLTDDIWTNDNVYSTSETEKAFGEKAKDANYQVRPKNEYASLMDKSITDDSTFVDEAMKRGEYVGFAYHIERYPHTIPIAEKAVAPKGRVLKSEVWSLRSEEGKEYETVKPKSDYEVIGEYQNADNFNTNETWIGAEDKLPTYHLYMWTKAPTPTPKKPPVPNTADTMY